MTVKDQLRTEFAEILVTHRYVYGQWDGATICRCGQPADRVPPRNASADHRAHVASVLASSPTVAALIDRVERAERERDELRGRCICNTGPNTDGPDETCPVHGREYGYWVEEVVAAQQREWATRSELAALRAAVKGLADELHAEAEAIRRSTGDFEDSDPYHSCADRIAGLLTEGADDGK